MITGKGESVPNTETEIDTAFKLTLISKRAKGEPRTKFTSLMHLLDAKYLKECYGELKRGKAAGIDGKVVEGYTEAEITQAIEDTILELKKRTYRPQPVRRVYIEKANGQKRPLGIPTVMDKVIQRGVAKILEALYEPTFLNISYGFRPGRNAHECLKELNHKIMGKKVNWVIKAEKKRLAGEAYLIRYADDFVICLQHKEEAQKVLADLKERLQKFGLELAEEKRYYRKVLRLIFKWLNRRSQKRTWNWTSFREYIQINPLPEPKLTYAIYNTW